MPRKIVEREIIDEDSELSGSEHSITNTEPTPPPTNKKVKNNKKETNKKETNIEKNDNIEIPQTELNKKLRTVNATKARIENKREKEIQSEVEKRLQMQKQKEDEHKKLKQSFETEVEAVINKIISRNAPQEEQVEKPQRRLEPKTPKPKPERKPKPVYNPEPEPEEINPYRLYKNLFM